MASRAVPVLRAASGLVALAAVAASSGAPLPARRSAVAGDLDFTFGRSGQVTTDISTVERRLRLANAWLARTEKTSSQRRARGSVRRAERVLARAGAAVERAGRDGTLSPPCAAAFRRLLDARLSQTRPEARR